VYGDVPLETQQQIDASRRHADNNTARREIHVAQIEPAISNVVATLSMTT
jgi:hypothetical protein